jgi:hypothetical protein
MKSIFLLSLLSVVFASVANAEGNYKPLTKWGQEAVKKKLELQTDLDNCRAEYKALLANSKAQLETLQKVENFNLRNFKEKKLEFQKAANAKAVICKQFKADFEKQARKVEQIRKEELESPMYQAMIAPAGKKVGPKIYCFQLGQNWEEFKACSLSLGIEPYLEYDNFQSGSLTAYFSSESHRINRIDIQGRKFWGTSNFDKLFRKKLKWYLGVEDWDLDFIRDVYEAKDRNWRAEVSDGKKTYFVSILASPIPSE